MSIVIANNDEKGFYIISDTKISFNEKNPCLISEPLKSNIEKYGMIKTIIICGHVALSFAGSDIRQADIVVSKIREKMCYLKITTFEEIYNLVLDLYNSKNNINPDDTHICDYILSYVIDGKVSMAVFKNTGIFTHVNRCYIGNANVYKDFCDLDVDKIIPNPDCIPKGNIILEPLVNIKFTPTGDVEQNTELMKSKMQELRRIVDLGCQDDVDSPIIGVYYNTQRKQFEYYYDKIYDAHAQIPQDGKVHPIQITQTNSGENYEVIPFKHFEGIKFYDYCFNYSVLYLYTNYYLDMDIKDYNNLLLPIYIKGNFNVDDITKVIPK